MNIIVSKKNIPAKGDEVVKLTANPERTVAELIFASGKRLSFIINPDEFNQAPVQKIERVKVTQIKPEGKTTQTIVRTESKQVNPMDKNTPSDQGYQEKAMRALAKMDGVPVEEIKEKFGPSVSVQSGKSGQVVMEAPSEDFKQRAAQALERSQERASKLANEIAIKSGAKLESSFGNNNTLEVKSI